jgi:hypothetical protein
MKIITHYRGKGILFILISMIYTSPTMDDQQNYSAYLLFIVGVVLMFVNSEKNICKSNSPAMSAQEIKINVNKTGDNMAADLTPSSNHIPANYLTVHSLKEEDITPKKTLNPYDIPDDF